MSARTGSRGTIPIMHRPRTTVQVQLWILAVGVLAAFIIGVRACFCGLSTVNIFYCPACIHLLPGCCLSIVHASYTCVAA